MLAFAASPSFAFTPMPRAALADVAFTAFAISCRPCCHDITPDADASALLRRLRLPPFSRYAAVFAMPPPLMTYYAPIF